MNMWMDSKTDYDPNAIKNQKMFSKKPV